MRVAWLLILAGCIPDFQLETRTFADGGALVSFEDAAPSDADFEDAEPDPTDASCEDAALEKDAGAETTDATPVDAPSEDASPEDALPGEDAEADAGEEPDAGEPLDADSPDLGADAGPDCEASCAPPECDLYVGNGWQCRNGVKAETACDDNLDNDGNGGFDCHDVADCGCLLGLVCCGNGNCAELLALCGG